MGTPPTSLTPPPSSSSSPSRSSSAVENTCKTAVDTVTEPVNPVPLHTIEAEPIKPHPVTIETIKPHPPSVSDDVLHDSPLFDDFSDDDDFEDIPVSEKQDRGRNGDTKRERLYKQNKEFQMEDGIENTPFDKEDNENLSELLIQWNPSITDTIGTSKLVFLRKVSFVEGSFNIIKYQNGTRKMSLVVRCPLFRGVLYKGFHCA